MLFNHVSGIKVFFLGQPSNDLSHRAMQSGIFFDGTGRCAGTTTKLPTLILRRRVCMPFWPAKKKKKKKTVDHPLQAGDIADFSITLHQSATWSSGSSESAQMSPWLWVCPLQMRWLCVPGCQLVILHDRMHRWSAKTKKSLNSAFCTPGPKNDWPMACNPTNSSSTKFQEASSMWPSATCGYLGWFHPFAPQVYPPIRIIGAKISAQWLFKSRQISKDVPASAENLKSCTNHMIWDQHWMYCNQHKN